MAKRTPVVDVLHEVQRAQRILRRIQRSLKATERNAKRAGEKAKERAELAQLAADARAADAVSLAFKLGREGPTPYTDEEMRRGLA
jgi:hypothetical protein